MKESLSTPSVLYRPVMLVSFGLTFLGFGLPIFAKAIGASAVEIGGLFTVFTLTTLLLRPLIGWALDRFGRRGILIAGMVAYALAMLLFSRAGNLPGLYLARFANGIASSLTWIAATTIVADLSPAENRAQQMGRINEMDMRGELIGAFIGFGLMNYLGDELGWKRAFLVFSLAAVLAAFLTWRTVPETRPETLASNAVKAVPHRLPRLFLWLLAFVFATAFSQALLSPIYLIYLQDRFTTDIGTLAFAFLPAGLLFAVLPSRMGALSDRFGRAPFMAIALLGDAVLFALLPVLPNLLWLVVLYTLTSVGWAMSIPAESALVADLLGRDERGRGYGLYNFMASLGAAFGPLVGGYLYDTYGHALPFQLSAVLLVVSAALVWVVLRGLSPNLQPVQ